MLKQVLVSSISITPLLTNIGPALDGTLRSTAATKIEDLGSASQPSTLRTPNGKPKLAIGGMSGRFPEAPSPEAFWDLLYEGLDVVKEVPAEKRWTWKTHVTTDGKGYNLAGCKWGC
jgi:noranthrone synthase